MITISVTFGLFITSLFFLFFLLCRYLIRPLTYFRVSINERNNQTFVSPYFQTWFTYSDRERWQRLNLLISSLHALVTSILTLYSFWAYPELCHDFVHHINFITYVTCSFSFS